MTPLNGSESWNCLLALPTSNGNRMGIEWAQAIIMGL